MAARMRALDWAATDLGAPAAWPQHLRIAVTICLPCRFPICLWWGKNLTFLYNDAFLPWLTKEKHPRVLGRAGVECWPEIWDEIGPMLEGVLTTGMATWSEDKELYYNRKLPKEEVYITWTYAPILAADGRTVDGIFCPCTETTEQIVGARRLETLRKLGIRSPETRTVEAACQQAATVLSENPRDLAFAAVYLVNNSGTEATMSASVIPGSSHLLPSLVSSSNDDSPWSLSSVLRKKRSIEVEDLSSLGVQIPGTPWAEVVDRAMVLPICGVADSLAGLLVTGVGPRRPWDAGYRSFFEMVAGHIGFAISDAKAYEEERLRAQALAQIDRAKTAFFSNVSHEFRTPLTLMLGPLRDILSHAANGFVTVGRDELDLVYRNSLRLLKLVNALLDFSRIEANRISAFYEPTDLATFTVELASFFRSAIESAGLVLSVDCPALGEPVYVDRSMWEKIVLNLMSNAFKFTLKGEIAISLRKGPGSVEFSVRDTGVGIREDQLARVFERFHRVEGVEGRTHEGSGIGLALVEELAGLHGGAVRVESVHGHGSEFTVSIPLGRAHLTPEHVGTGSKLPSITPEVGAFVTEAEHWRPEPPRAASVEQSSPSSQVEGEAEHRIPHLLAAEARSRILLADDNAEMRRYVQRLLEKHYDVQAVANGKAALISAQAHPPDLILSDIMMPRMDGLRLVVELRKDSRTRGIPVILISARAGEESQVNAFEIGADDYLVKPFSARELLARIGSLILLKRTRDILQAELATKEENLSALTRELIASKRALQRNEAHLAEGQRISHTGTCTWNPSTGELLWSKEHCRIFGVSPDEPRQPYTAFLNSIHPQDRDFVDHSVHTAFQQRIAFDIEYRIIRPDGSIKYIHALGQPSIGDHVDFIGTVMDITERKKAEEEVRRSEAYLAQSERLSHTGSWAWNVATGELFWSEEHYRILGLTPNGTKPSFPEALLVIHPEDRPAVQQAFADLPKNGGIFEMDCRILRPDGAIRFIHSRADPVFNRSGELIEYAGTMIDNTERKEAEEALQKAQTELAHMARVTTMGELAASIAHEVNQPLSSVVNDAGACLAWLGRADPNIAEASSAASRIMDQGIRASQVLSRISALLKKSAPQMSIIDMNEIIEDVLSLTRHAMLRQNIALETELADPLFRVRGDSVQLKQVLANLVVNAIEAMRESSAPARNLFITSRNSGPDEITVAVRDSGTGIDPATAKELFKPFVTRKTEGMGMGLAISRSIIEAHRGRLWAINNQPAGATFQFCLPALQIE
jgi:PAS domain S-box-containing protein